MHFCTWTLLQAAVANRGLLRARPLWAAASRLLSKSEFKKKNRDVLIPLKISKLKKKKYPFISRSCCLDHQQNFAFFLICNICWLLYSSSVITSENKSNVSFLESILSKHYFKETSTGNTLLSVNEGTFFVVAISFCNFTELWILRDLVSSNHYITVLTEVNKT